MPKSPTQPTQPMQPTQPRQQISPVLEQLPDGLLLTVLTKLTSFVCLQNLRAAYKGTNALIASEEHSAARASEGIVDRALVIVSRERHGFVYHVLVNGKWRCAPWNAGNPMEEYYASVITRSASGEHVLFAGETGFRRCALLVHATTGQRHSLPCYMVERRDPAVCHWGDRTILAGGHRLASVEMYDPSSNIWTYLPDMPHATYRATAVVIGKKVYVAGGKGNGRSKLTYLQVYDTMLETWELGPEMPEYLYMTSGAVVEDKLYIVGKSDATNSYVCVYFIPDSREWKYTASIETPGPLTGTCPWQNPRSCHAVNHNGSLWVLYEGREFTANYWRQLEDNGEWSKVSSGLAQEIPDQLVGNIKAVVSAVIMP